MRMVYLCLSCDFMHPVSCVAPSGKQKKKNIGERWYSSETPAVVAVLQLRPQPLFCSPLSEIISLWHTFTGWVDTLRPRASGRTKLFRQSSSLTIHVVWIQRDERPRIAVDIRHVSYATWSYLQHSSQVWAWWASELVGLGVRLFLP